MASGTAREFRVSPRHARRPLAECGRAGGRAGLQRFADGSGPPRSRVAWNHVACSLASSSVRRGLFFLIAPAASPAENAPGGVSKLAASGEQRSPRPL